MMEKIALFYAPAKGSTEKVAKLVQEKIGKEKVDLVLIEDNSEPIILKPYSKVIFGISTVGRENWESKYTKIGWDFFLPKLENIDFKGKTIAIFGLGDHIHYPNHFVNAMGFLAVQVINNGGNLVGKTSAEGYEFNESEAFEDGMFYGLPIDEENEPELTNSRVTKWLSEISKHFGF